MKRSNYPILILLPIALVFIFLIRHNRVGEDIPEVESQDPQGFRSSTNELTAKGASRIPDFEAGFPEVDRNREPAFSARVDLLRRSQPPAPATFELRISGNRSFSKEEIEQAITLPEDTLVKDVATLVGAQVLKFYHVRGFDQAEILETKASGVQPTVVMLEVDEGEAYVLIDLEIRGTTVLSADEIRELYPPIGSTVTLPRLRQADIRLAQKYGEFGYARAKIQGQHSQNDAELTFTYAVRVQEGPQYRVRFVSGPIELISKFPMRKGDVFNSSLLDEFRISNHLDGANPEVQYTPEGLVDITIQELPSVPND